MDTRSHDTERGITTELSHDLAPAPEFTQSIDAFLDHIADLPIGEPHTYGATPLNRIATLHQQLELAEDLRRSTLTNIPEGMPQEIVNYIKPTFSERFHKRGEANEENFLSALRRKEEFADSPEITDMIERGELGFASVGELLAIRSLLGIRSVELGCVSHPYGNRIDTVYAMRAAVKAHVERLGGMYDDTPEERYRVKSIICPNHENSIDDAVGFLITKKTTHGIMEDGTIIRERASFVLRTDVPGVMDHLHAMRGVVARGEKDWQSQLVERGHLIPIIEELKENDAFCQLVPISSTIYAFNPETAEQVYEKQRIEREERQKKFAEAFPELAKHIDEVRSGKAEQIGAPKRTRVTEITDRMYYNGPPLA